MFANKEAKIQIAKALDLSGISDAQKDKIISSLLDVISLRVNLAIFDKLDATDKVKVQKLLKTNDSQSISHYLNGRIKNLQQIMEKITEEAVEEFKRSSV